RRGSTAARRPSSGRRGHRGRARRRARAGCPRRGGSACRGRRGRRRSSGGSFAIVRSEPYIYVRPLSNKIFVKEYRYRTMSRISTTRISTTQTLATAPDLNEIDGMTVLQALSDPVRVE